MSDFTLKVGAVEIVALSDMNFPFPIPLPELFSTVPDKAWAPYRESYPDTFDGDHMLIEIGCYLVRSQGRTILIDTGYGEGPIESIGGRRGELMDDLAAKGVTPEEIDTVFISHLHSDHVGWNVVEQDGSTGSPLSPTPGTSLIRLILTTSTGRTFKLPPVFLSWRGAWNPSST